MSDLQNNDKQTNSASTSGGSSVLILGATGGFGGELTRQMANQGWEVRAITRQPRGQGREAENGKLVTQASDQGRYESAKENGRKNAADQINWIVGDLEVPETLIDAAKNVDVIVHAVNVPYQHWNPTMVNYTRTIIELALKNDAHLMFVGNVYNAGLPANGMISEHTPNAPVTEKGEIRAQLEDMIKDASSRGLRSTIMRFGDFFGPDVPTSNWFGICTKDVPKNKLMIAGARQIPHTWAYLPDAAKAFARVAALRIADADAPRHMVLPFTGHVFSFGQLAHALESITGQAIKISTVPWTVFKILGLVVRFMRELVSMRYLWQHDVQMDGSALTQLLGEAPEHTDLDEAILSSVPNLVDVRHNRAMLCGVPT